jgi:DnaJ-class molecular chaperone
MTTTRCLRCAGAGNYLGTGMTPIDCAECSGRGTIAKEAQVSVLNIKESNGYKSARNRLMDSNPVLTEDEADKLLEEAFEKEKTPRKRKS